MHMCNTNLKNGVTRADPSSGHDLVIKNQHDAIEYNDKTIKSLAKLNADNPEPEGDKKIREEKNEKNMREIKNRLERREYIRLTGSIEGFSNKKEYERIRERDDVRFFMAFGIGFITMTFLGFLTGFLLGRYILEWPEDKSLIMSLVFGISTLILEMIMMIFRLEKWQKI
jgi:hypothetical protein